MPRVEVASFSADDFHQVKNSSDLTEFKQLIHCGVERDLAWSLFDKCALKKDGQIQNDNDLLEIKEAAHLLAYCFEGDKRKNGEPASTHSFAVAHILADEYIKRGAEIDKEVIIAALTHDWLEDTKDKPVDRRITSDHIREMFGDSVGGMVEDLTKIKSRKLDRDLPSRTHLQIFEALLTDPRTILIKLADRLHNMRTIEFLSPRKQTQKASETLKVYVPLAVHLGLNNWAQELIDLSIEVLFGRNQQYQRLKEKCDQLFSDEILEFINGKFIDRLDDRVAEIHLGRPSFYELYREYGEQLPQAPHDSLVGSIDVYITEPGNTTQMLNSPERYQTDWEADVLACFHIINKDINALPHGASEIISDAFEKGDIPGMPITPSGRAFDLRFMKREDKQWEQASLWDYYLKKAEDVLHQFAHDKLLRLQQNLQRVLETGGVKAVVAEFLSNLGVELIRTEDKDRHPRVFPKGQARVLDLAWAASYGVGKYAVDAAIYRNGSMFPASLDEVLQEGDWVIVNTATEGDDIWDPKRMNVVQTPYAQRLERQKFQRRMTYESNLAVEKRTVTERVIKRGSGIIADLFRWNALKKGYGSAQLIVIKDHAQEAYRNHHRYLKLAREGFHGNGLDREELLADFLTHVGLDEISLEGKGREIISKVVDTLVDFQMSLIPIQFDLADQPGVFGKVGVIFAQHGVNLEAVESIGHDTRANLQRGTVFITPEALPIFNSELKEELLAAKIDGQSIISEIDILPPLGELSATQVEALIISSVGRELLNSALT